MLGLHINGERIKAEYSNIWNLDQLVKNEKSGSEKEKDDDRCDEDASDAAQQRRMSSQFIPMTTQAPLPTLKEHQPELPTFRIPCLS